MLFFKNKLTKAKVKIISIFSLLLAVAGSIPVTYAITGDNFDPNNPPTASTRLPYFTNINVGNGEVTYDLNSYIQTGSTKGSTFYYRGMTRLWLENSISGEINLSKGSGYYLAMNGERGTSDSQSGYAPIPSNLIDLIPTTTTNPGIYTSGINLNYGGPRVCAGAYGGSKRGTAEFELDVYLNDWYGPGDNEIFPWENGGQYGITDTSRTSGSYYEFNCTYSTVKNLHKTVSSTDPILYYYYTYDNSSYNYTVSYGSYGAGDYFSDSPDLSNAGKYCHVTFYTQSGASCSTVIKVPDAVNLTYNLNGGTGTTPSSQKVWAGQSVRIASNSSTRTNCEFLGWSTTKYDVLEYGKTVSTLSQGTAYTLNSNTTLYAVWRTVKVPYTINFTLNGNKPAKNDFAYITGYVNGGTRVTQSREFSYLEIPGYTVSAKIKSSDENVFIMVGDNKSPGYEYTIPTKTINTGTTDTVNCGTIHTVAYDANGGTYGKDAAGNDIPGPEDMTKYYGTSIVVSSNTPTRIGYNFTQWKSDTTGTSYNPGTGYAHSQRGGTDTLKAQ